MKLFRCWPTFLFLIAVFFFAHHKIHFSTAEEEFGHFKSADEIAESTARGSLPRQISLLSLGLFGLLIAIFSKRRIIRVQGLLGLLLLFYIFLAGTSFLWSDSPIFTLKKLTVFLMFCLGALGVAKKLENLEILSFVFLGCFVFLFMGIIAEVHFGVFNPLGENYRFVGTIAPNHQAWNCAFLVFSSLALVRVVRRWSGLFYSVAVIAFVFLILTRSRSAFGGVLIAFLISWILVSSRIRKTAVLCSVVVFVALSFLFFGGIFSENVQKSALLGRNDPDNVQELSGRLPLWKECVRYARNRPWFGYGFNSFWSSEHILQISDRVGWPAPGAHNGYLDIVLSLGLLGGANYTMILLVGLARVNNFRRYGHEGEGKFFFVTLLFYSLVMIMEEIANVVCIPSFIVMVILVKFGLLRDGELRRTLP